MRNRDKDPKSIRDLLLPGLWGLCQRYELNKGYDLQIGPDGGLYLEMWKERQKSADSILICSQSELENGSYLTRFSPRLSHILSGMEH